MPPLLERVGRNPHGARPVIGLVIDSVDWHARELIGALRARAIETIPVRLTRCGFATQSPTGLHLDGFDGALPDGLVVRTMSGGTCEAVTLRLGVLHALRELGVLVWNDARAIERCVDKSMTSFLLSRAGIATPATWTTESYDEARAIVQRQAADGPLVHGMVAGLAPELREGRRAILVALQGRCLCCQMLQSAWVGDRRAARMAGSSPAAAPMSRAAARPPAQASRGMTMAQPLAWA